MKINTCLITSASNKIPLINSIRSSFKVLEHDMKVIGADSNKSALAQHFIDQFWHMPLLDNIPVNELINYCKKNDIQIIFPTREGELTYFAEHRDTLKRENIFVMVSDLKA